MAQEFGNLMRRTTGGATGSDPSLDAAISNLLSSRTDREAAPVSGTGATPQSARRRRRDTILSGIQEAGEQPKATTPQITGY